MTGDRSDPQLHLVVPGGVDDPARPSGGNRYDRRVAAELVARGHSLVEHGVDGAWPRPDREALGRLAGVLRQVPDQATVLVDGLVASAAPGVLVPTAGRLRLAVLVHQPVALASPGAHAGERAVLRAASTVVATSTWSRDWLQRSYRLPAVAVAAPGVDPAPAATASAAGDRLLCVGRVGRSKGHDLLADALRRVGDLPWRCTWVGPLDEPGLAAGVPRVEVTGPLSTEELATRYTEADLLLLPSRAESFGMVITEALARGVPVLASTAGGIAEAVGRAPTGAVPALLVPPGDAAALAGALRRWLTDPTVRRRLRAAAAGRRHTLTGWDLTTQRLVEALALDPVGSRS